MMAVTKRVPSADTDSVYSAFGFPGTVVPGFHLPPLRG